MPVSNPVHREDVLNYNIWRYILDFIHPCLHYITIKDKSPNSNTSVPVPLLPIELLISLDNTAVLEEFKNVLLSLRFRVNLRLIVAKYGSLATLKWFRSSGIILTKFYSLYPLADRGEFESIKWAISTGCQFLPSKLLEYAARVNKPNIIEWMMDNYPSTIGTGDHILNGAISGGHIQMLYWIETHLPHLISIEREFEQSRCVTTAARKEDLTMLHWLQERGLSFHCSVYTEAAGSLEVLKFLRANNCPWSDTFCVTVAGKGNLEMLKFARSDGCPWVREDILNAIASARPRLMNFDASLLQWLVEQGCAVGWDDGLVSVASRFGNFEFIKLAKANGLTAAWDPNIKKIAAIRGDLEALIWALDQDSKENVTDKCLYVLSINAASGGHLHVLEWLQAEFGSSFVLDPQICVVAARAGKIKVLNWAVNNGCVWSRYNCCIAAIKRSQLEVLIWLKEQPFLSIGTEEHHSRLWYGYVVGKEHPSVCAAEVGNLEVFQWLHLNGCPWHTSTYASAQVKDHTEILDWALKNGCPRLRVQET